MKKGLTIRKALMPDAPKVDALLSEWLDWRPSSGRLKSVRRAITDGELVVAEHGSRIIGFIHRILHEDIVDGAPNSFISAFYVSPEYRGKGVGTLLLEEAIAESLKQGAVGVETSTTHAYSKAFYEKHFRFKQAYGDIGEVFLELDLGEYLGVKKAGRREHE